MLNSSGIIEFGQLIFHSSMIRSHLQTSVDDEVER